MMYLFRFSIIFLVIGSAGWLFAVDYLDDARWVVDELTASYVDIACKEQRGDFDWHAQTVKYLENVSTVTDDRQMYLLTNQLVAQLQDGHLFFKYANGAVRNAILTYPDAVINMLQLRLVGNAVYIVAAPAGYGLAGARLLKINDVSIDTMLDSLQTVYAFHGSQDASRQQLLVYNRFWDYFDLFASGFPDSVQLTLADHTDDVVLHAKDYATRPEVITGGRWGLPTENPHARVTWLERNLALITIPSFDLDIQAFQTFMDTTVRSCAQRGITGVIIDIRYNRGGNESFRDLLGYLCSDTLDIAHYRYRLSPALQRDFPGRLAWEVEHRKVVAPASDGEHSLWLTWQIYPNQLDYLTSIPVVLLVNPSVFSSADKVVYAAKHHGLATIIGSPVTLSGHGLGKRVKTPSGRFVLQNCYFDARGLGFEKLENQIIDPDVLVENTTDSILAEGDEQLERAIDFLLSQ